MKKLLVILIIFFYIQTLYGASAALGCCVDSSSGMCTPESLSDSCQGDKFQFYNDRTCNSVSSCLPGCCSIGLEKRFIPESTCYQLAKTVGIEHSWAQISQEECTRSSTSEETGACVIETRFDSKCIFTQQKNCQGSFHIGLLCTNPILNSTCEKTSKTMCYNGDVYAVDSCGNPDEKKQTCNYDEGKICEVDKTKNAVCRDLNCKDKFGNFRKNGETWCIGLDGEVLLEDVRDAVFKKPHEKEPQFNDAVGSDFFRQECINGEIITDPCGGHRNEICVPPKGNNQAQCIQNEAYDCLMANSINEQTGKNEIGSCNPEFCYESRLDDCVSFGSDGHDMVCGKDRSNWRDYAGNNGLSTDGVAEVTSPLLGELDLVMCLPKITLGSDIGGSRSYKQGDQGDCSLGDFEGATWLDHDKSVNAWRVKENDKGGEVDYSSDPKKYGNAGLISLIEDSWKYSSKENGGYTMCYTKTNPLLSIDSECYYLYYTGNGSNCWCSHNDGYLTNKRVVDKLISDGSIPDPKLYELLNARTIGLGDCAGSSNFLDKKGSFENEISAVATRGTSGRSDHMLFSVSYTSNAFSPPSSGDCSLCGKDNLPCTEYRCQAIGKNCEYIEPRDGMEKAYCVSSSDSAPPQISHSIDPKSPIPPFSSVQININTNEASYCRFSLGEAGNSFDGMRYDVDKTYNTKHSMVLHVPGKATIDDSDLTEYSLITRDGKYDLFVRCQDVAGNTNLAAYKISFEVMQTPDEVPPAILNITPKSGSPIKYNTTEKEISIKLNEPAECRWDFEDKNYDDMGIIITEIDESYEDGDYDDDINYAEYEEDFDYEDEEIEESGIYTFNQNQFLCDTEVTDNNILNGYYCTGILTNITTNISKVTDYYIRCKDQPWLEGEEDSYYHRNANTVGTKYTLRNSEPLEITELTPSGEIILAPDTTNFTITVKTKGGGYNGQANCSWRLKYGETTTVFYPFENTNSNIHKQAVLDKSDGDYDIEVKCIDEAGNTANKSSLLKLRYDRTSPEITRIYNNRGNVKVVTNEPAICKFVNILDFAFGCAFSVTDNKSQSMSSNKLEHTMKLVKGLTYYIKCKDYYENQDSICTTISSFV